MLEAFLKQKSLVCVDIFTLYFIALPLYNIFFLKLTLNTHRPRGSVKFLPNVSLYFRSRNTFTCEL